MSIPVWVALAVALFCVCVIATVVIIVCVTLVDKGVVCRSPGFWIHAPSKLRSPLGVNGVILHQTNERARGVAVKKTTFISEGSINVTLEPYSGSPWPPSGILSLNFKDTVTDESATVRVWPHEWKKNRTSITRVVFKSTSSSALADVPRAPPQTRRSKIPFRLVQSYRLPYVKNGMFTAMQSFTNTNIGLETCFYGNRTMRKFISEHFDVKVLEALDSLSPGAYKCDLFRLCELFVNGGVYADVSMVCLEPLHYLLDDTDLVVVRDTPTRNMAYLYNAFIIARPGLPFLKFAIEELVEKALSRDYGTDPLSVTGPGIFGPGLNRFAKRASGDCHTLGSGDYGGMKVKVLENLNGFVSDTERGVALIQNKYENWTGDREGNPHYWGLWRMRAVFCYRIPENFHAGQALTKSGAFPRFLYQSWETKHPPPFLRDNIRLIRDKAVAAGWGYKFADDFERASDIDKLAPCLSSSVMCLREAFNRVLPGGMRAQIWGLVNLAVNGGVYMDTHAQPCQEFFENFDPEVPWMSVNADQKPSQVTGHLWVFPAMHPFILEVLRQCVYAVHQRRDGHTRVSEWFKLSVDVRSGASDLVRVKVRGNKVQISEHISFGARFNGYDSERVSAGGEDPQALSKLGQCLNPDYQS